MSDTTNIAPKTFQLATSTNLSGKEGYACDIDGALLEAATSIPYVITNGVNGSGTASQVTVARAGVAYFKAGGSITKGDRLTPTTAGVWIATVTDTDNVGGVALADAASCDLVAGLVERYPLSI